MPSSHQALQIIHIIADDVTGTATLMTSACKFMVSVQKSKNFSWTIVWTIVWTIICKSQIIVPDTPHEPYKKTDEHIKKQGKTHKWKSTPILLSLMTMSPSPEYPIFNEISDLLDHCAFHSHCLLLTKKHNSFEVCVSHDLFAAGDEVAQILAFEHAVGEKGEVGDLLEDAVGGGKGLKILLVGLGGGILCILY